MDAPKTTPAPESKLHFLDYWRIIRIRKTVILAVFLLVVLTTTAVTFILPESYCSTVRIEVGKDNPDIAPLLLNLPQQQTFDPYFIQTEFEKIRSTRVLHAVIKDLSLNKAWAKRYVTEEDLKTSETYQMLLKQIDLRQSRNTSLIEIRAYSEDKKEAAAIANRIAEVYQESRPEQKRKMSRDGIKVLQAEMEEQTEKVEAVQSKVDKLRNEFKISDVGEGAFMTTLEPETVRKIERDRISAEGNYVQFDTLFKELKKKSRL